jgi:hypothetical protein
MFFLDVEELSSKTLIGTAVVSAAALDDGCTAFWAAGRWPLPTIVFTFLSAFLCSHFASIGCLVYLLKFC